jgi:hypothetical protein
MADPSGPSSPLAEVAERLYQEGVGPRGERIIQYAAPKNGEDQAAAEAAGLCPSPTTDISAEPQVSSMKNPLTMGAPSRIRTCAHGSGGRCSIP